MPWKLVFEVFDKKLSNLLKKKEKTSPQTCISISCLNRDNVITDARSLCDSGVIRTFLEHWFVIINIRQCHIHKDSRWFLIGCLSGTIRSLYFQAVCRFRLPIQWRMNVYLSGSWLNTKTSVFISSNYLVSEEELKNDKELIYSAFSDRKTKRDKQTVVCRFCLCRRTRLFSGRTKTEEWTVRIFK